MSLLVRLGNYISKKPNFIKASIWGFGMPWGVLMALFLRESGLWLLPVLLAPVAGYLWGLGMWHLYFKSMYAQREKQAGGQDRSK